MISLEQIRATAETGFYIAAVGAVIGGLVRYFRDQDERRRQRREEIDQRNRELRWRQADGAKRLMDDFVADAAAKNAMLMLDSWSRAYTVAGVNYTIDVEQWQRALATGPDMATDPISTFVRDSFDAFFFHLAGFEHHVRNGFVAFDDVEFPISYYVRIMREDRDIYLNYMQQYGLHRAEAFLKRFPAWNAEVPQAVVM